jgi:hypothetical protein
MIVGETAPLSLSLANTPLQPTCSERSNEKSDDVHEQPHRHPPLHHHHHPSSVKQIHHAVHLLTHRGTTSHEQLHYQTRHSPFVVFPGDSCLAESNHHHCCPTAAPSTSAAAADDYVVNGGKEVLWRELLDENACQDYRCRCSSRDFISVGSFCWTWLMLMMDGRLVKIYGWRWMME